MFSFISKISPTNINSWKNKVFLTFDIDWAHDDIISDTFNLVKNFNLLSTWFVTHETSMVEKLSLEKTIELGIHPNFNPLLNGNSEKDSTEVLKKSLDIVPSAVSIRSHSLTQNERLLDQFKQFGLTHISNNFIPFGCGINIKPFCVWDKIIIVPHCWQDNVSLKMNLSFPQVTDFATGLCIFDFHPIHVFLNTESLDRYERTRPFHQNPEELIKHRFDGYGTRSKLLELLKMGLN